MDAPQPPAPDPAPLGPHCVGQRVVVRHLLVGRQGPSGGPAMTDVRGVLTRWDGDLATLETDDGLVEVLVSTIVAGKPIPPAPPRPPRGSGARD